MRLVYLLSLFCLSQLIEVGLTQSNTKLVMLQIVSRHGIRTILQNYPTYPLNGVNYYNGLGGYGQLSFAGVKQMNEFGKYMRSRYPTLNKVYNTSRVYVRSTDKDRTLGSMTSFLSGFFKPTSPFDIQNYGKTTGFFPIPVHTENYETDAIFRADNCALYLQIKAQSHVSAEFLAKQNANKVFLQKMSTYSGLNLTNNYYYIWKIADNALVDKAHNRPVAKWISDNWKDIVIGNDLTFYIDFSTIQMAKLTSGGILNTVVSNINKKVSGSTTREFFLYGSHDNYISGLQKLLNTSTTFVQPNFGSAFIFELRNDTAGNYYVQVFYKNNLPNEPIKLEPVTIYGCAQLCPLNTFLSITQPNLISNYDTSGICDIPSTSG